MRHLINFTLLLLLIATSPFSTTVLATHETTERYDGTINSFRWLKNPIDVAEVSIHNDQGEGFALSRFDGKIVLLNLWASWCKPCIYELPALDRLQKRLGGDDFIVVAVSIDSEPELARRMFVDLSIGSMVFYHENADAMGRHFPVDVLPTTFMIDRDGRVLGLLRSSLDWDNTESDKLINRLIAGVNVATLRAEKAQRQQAEE